MPKSINIVIIPLKVTVFYFVISNGEVHILELTLINRREFLLVLQDSGLLMPDREPTISVVSVPLAIKVFKQVTFPQILTWVRKVIPDEFDNLGAVCS